MLDYHKLDSVEKSVLEAYRASEERRFSSTMLDTRAMSRGEGIARSENPDLEYSYVDDKINLAAIAAAFVIAAHAPKLDLPRPQIALSDFSDPDNKLRQQMIFAMSSVKAEAIHLGPYNPELKVGEMDIRVVSLRLINEVALAQDGAVMLDAINRKSTEHLDGIRAEIVQRAVSDLEKTAPDPSLKSMLRSQSENRFYQGDSEDVSVFRADSRNINLVPGVAEGIRQQEPMFASFEKQLASEHSLSIENRQAGLISSRRNRVLTMMALSDNEISR